MNNTYKASTSDIERLVRASQADDRGAFDELVRLYQRKAMQTAVRMLGNANEAADIVQVSFVKAYVSIRKLKEPKRFGVWLLRIVANAAISQRRVMRRRLEKMKIVDCYKGEKSISPAEKGIAEELNEAMREAMLRLSKKEAKAISLFGMEDLSHRQVAEIMGCSVEAVRWHVFKARQKLKVLLKDYL